MFIRSSGMCFYRTQSISSWSCWYSPITLRLIFKLVLYMKTSLFVFRSSNNRVKSEYLVAILLDTPAQFNANSSAKKNPIIKKISSCILIITKTFFKISDLFKSHKNTLLHRLVFTWCLFTHSFNIYIHL